MIELKFYKSPWQAIKLILLSSPFIIICLYDIINHNDKSMPLSFDWFGLCFFGLGIPLGLFNLFDKRPAMIINEVGIFKRKTSKDLINWTVIEDAYLKDLRVSILSKQKFLCLVIDPSAPIILNANKTLIRFSERLGFQGISIPLNDMKKYDWEKLLLFIKSMSHSDHSERQKLLLNYEP
jgi:hypothetical protein